MTTKTEDNELQAELRELHIKSKKWVLDLNELISNLNVLKEYFVKASSITIPFNDFENTANLLVRASLLNKTPSELKSERLHINIIRRLKHFFESYPKCNKPGHYKIISTGKANLVIF